MEARLEMIAHQVVLYRIRSVLYVARKMYQTKPKDISLLHRRDSKRTWRLCSALGWEVSNPT